MKMDEYTKINHGNKQKLEDKKIKYFKFLITRILLSIILIISVCIFIKLDEKNLQIVDNSLFKESLKFTQINSWYQKKAGKIIPELNNSSNMVFSSEDLKKNTYENYKDGVKINVDKNSPVSLLYGGIVVFIGEKDDYGNTLILQGNDGIDYWYGGIENINVNLYDYLEKDTLIGTSKENYIYLVLQKGSEFLNYEKTI